MEPWLLLYLIYVSDESYDKHSKTETWLCISTTPCEAESMLNATSRPCIFGFLINYASCEEFARLESMV